MSGISNVRNFSHSTKNQALARPRQDLVDRQQAGLQSEGTSTLVGQSDGVLLGQDSAGELRWTARLPNAKGQVFAVHNPEAGPLDAKIVATTSDGKVFGLSPTGVTQWVHTGVRGIESAARIDADGVISVQSDQGPWFISGSGQRIRF